MGQEGGAVGREFDPAGGSCEQGEAKLVFQLPNLLAEGGLGEVETSSRPPEVEFLGDGDEGIESLEARPVIHAGNVSIWANSILHSNDEDGQTLAMGILSGSKKKPPAKYSAVGLAWRGLRKQSWPRIWREPEFRNTYDVIIIGGGVHGLATAYYLAANHGITNVAVVDKQYLGSGGSGRNTAIVLSNYLTPEGVAFYDRSLELYNSMSSDLNLNVMFSERGHLTLAHTDSALRTMNWRAEVNKLQGIDSAVIDPA